MENKHQWDEIREKRERVESNLLATEVTLCYTYCSEISRLTTRIVELPSLLRQFAHPPGPWSGLNNRDDLEKLLWAHQRAYNRANHCHEELMKIAVWHKQDEGVQNTEQEGRRLLLTAYDAIKLGEAQYRNMLNARPVDEMLENYDVTVSGSKTSPPLWEQFLKIDEE